MYDLPGEMTRLIHDRGTAKGAGKAKGRGGLCLNSLLWKSERRGPQEQEARMDVGKTRTGQIRTYVGSLETLGTLEGGQIDKEEITSETVKFRYEDIQDRTGRERCGHL